MCSTRVNGRPAAPEFKLGTGDVLGRWLRAAGCLLRAVRLQEGGEQAGVFQSRAAEPKAGDQAWAAGLLFASLCVCLWVSVTDLQVSPAQKP